MCVVIFISIFIYLVVILFIYLFLLISANPSEKSTPKIAFSLCHNLGKS